MESTESHRSFTRKRNCRTFHQFLPAYIAHPSSE